MIMKYQCKYGNVPVTYCRILPVWYCDYCSNSSTPSELYPYYGNKYIYEIRAKLIIHKPYIYAIIYVIGEIVWMTVIGQEDIRLCKLERPPGSEL